MVLKKILNRINPKADVLKDAEIKISTHPLNPKKIDDFIEEIYTIVKKHPLNVSDMRKQFENESSILGRNFLEQNGISVEEYQVVTVKPYIKNAYIKDSEQQAASILVLTKNTKDNDCSGCFILNFGGNPYFVSVSYNKSSIEHIDEYLIHQGSSNLEIKHYS